jgi:Tfp pilus assembly protein PilX
VRSLRQVGLVLPATLLLLLFTSLVTVTLLRVAQAEQRLAGNLQQYQQYQQTRLLAEALLAQLVRETDAFDPSLPPGALRCRPGAGCERDDLVLVLPEGALPVGMQASWSVRRLQPAWLENWPFRQRESSVSTALSSPTAVFEASVTVDARALQGGRSRRAVGIALRGEPRT